jgi:hypothetical protein
MAEKICCSSTPSREIAEAHPKDHFGWMSNLSNIDTVDAALCALTAHFLAREKFK